MGPFGTKDWTLKIPMKFIWNINRLFHMNLEGFLT